MSSRAQPRDLRFISLLKLIGFFILYFLHQHIKGSVGISFCFLKPGSKLVFAFFKLDFKTFGYITSYNLTFHFLASYRDSCFLNGKLFLSRD